ncbi:MAG: M14 family zinc carboxypeptidase [Cryomorphaceae bacterium]
MRPLLLFILSFASLLANSQDHTRVKIWLDPITEGLLQTHGVEMDHGVRKPGVFLINDFDEATLAWMDEAGVKYDVLIDDVTAFYRSRVEEVDAARGGRSTCFEGGGDTVAVPDNFITGSMGGFYTYEEYLAQLDSMHTLYPNLITSRDSIDTFLTHEGRPIYWVKISDNASVNENEPEVLYTAIHHAREPQSLTQLIFYMWYLLENYGTNDEVTGLVDEVEMYLVPMLNPDGYKENQTAEPNGGGLWRKNKRNNGDGTFGVDLNRNYGYEWAHDNNGSSPNTNSQTYRGPSAFSEPETKAIKWFCEEHAFGIALNYHSYGNYLIYPWGFNDQFTPDSSTFIAFATEMTKFNNYVYGTGMETVGYAVNGDSDDWMYGEQNTKDKIISMTPEVGNQGDGFWPSPSRIEPLSQENVHPNLTMAHLVGDYASIADHSPNIIDSLNPTIPATATRLGMQFNGPYTFSLEAVSSNIASVGNSVILNSMDQLVPNAIDLQMELDPLIQQGEEVVFDLVAAFGTFETKERVTKVFGSPTVLLSNQGNMDDFLTGSLWDATDETYYSPDHSITDSPYAQYQNGQNSELIYNRIIDLREADKGLLTFKAKWFVEAGWDFVQVLASPINEENWSPLCGKYSVEGNQYQDLGQPLWDGYQSDWVDEEVDLDDYLGERIQIKFKLESDNFLTYDGFYFDDLEVVALLSDGFTQFPDTGYVDTIGTTPVDTNDSTIGVGAAAPNTSLWTPFPNPADDLILIPISSRLNAEARLYTSSGVLVRKQRISHGKIYVEGLPSGTYFLRITAESIGRSEVHNVVIFH